MQAAQPLGDKQAQVAALHERTRDIMDKLRETLRDEHSFSFQVRAQRRVSVAYRLPRIVKQETLEKATLLWKRHGQG